MGCSSDGLRGFSIRQDFAFSILLRQMMTEYDRRSLPLHGGRSFLHIRRRTSLLLDLYGVDHRPSDFDLPINPLKNRNWRITMKEINLREYYPFYTQDVIVEVPDEVADLLRELKLADAASFLRTYRHKAYFSLDYDTNVERDALVVVLTPAEILEQKEENARLYQAIASLPEKQRNRITSHFLLGMSISEIAKSEGSGASSVHEGIQRGLRRLKKILKKMESDPEKNA